MVSVNGVIGSGSPPKNSASSLFEMWKILTVFLPTSERIYTIRPLLESDKI